MAKSYIALTEEQIKLLQMQGCTAEDWKNVLVSDRFEPMCVRNAHFFGKVKIGDLSGKIRSTSGLEKRCGIYDATIINCAVGDNVRIANVGVHLANYDIAENVCIENIGTMQTNPGATFGNGVEVAALNEAGLRKSPIFNQINSQFAYLMYFHKYRPKMVEKLKAIAVGCAKSVKSDYGRIGSGVRICSVNEIIDVNVGDFATVNGAAKLVNGTILSSKEASVLIGSDVCAEDFIIAESSSVTEGAILDKVYVGQGCQIGKGFSAENCVFFANCQGFHGEAVSIFAGPYTVSSHKASLMIGAGFSFFNAGGGSSHSNHMYKLGSVHEGKMERGVKVGSLSYMMWPVRIGPFSVLLGKHTRNFDTADFPFSHLEATPDGKCMMIPGMHLVTVGTVRDAVKWLRRDKRKGSVLRDNVSFEVLSPYTVSKMIRANRILKELQDNTERSVEEVTINGTQVKRILLRKGQKFYRTGIEVFLLEKIFEKAGQGFAIDANAVYSDEWVDIGGQLMPKQRMLGVVEKIESGKITDVESFQKEMNRIYQAYEADRWLWVVKIYKQYFGGDLQKLTKEEIIELAEKYKVVKTKFLKQILVDAEKEFNEFSRTGFGADGSIEERDEDFRRVRGLYEENEFVEEMQEKIKEIENRVQKLKDRI